MPVTELESPAAEPSADVPKKIKKRDIHGWVVPGLIQGHGEAHRPRERERRQRSPLIEEIS